MPEGLVTRAQGGFFDVQSDEETRRCRARGVFKKRGVTVWVGDHVRFDPIGSKEGIITEVLPRRTMLIRPPIANIDQVLLVFSVVTPDLNIHLLDRTLVSALCAGLDAVLVLTKCDLATSEQVAEFERIYRTVGLPVLTIAAKLGVGVEEVRAHLAGKLTVFAGPSGAGKSTLANAILPELGLKMGEVSEKIGLGRHTTRHVELFQVAEETWVADAPGFSQLDVDVPSSELRLYFPEFAHVQPCPYRGCLHVEEADCQIKQAVTEGRIEARRYESYCMIFREIREREERRY